MRGPLLPAAFACAATLAAPSAARADEPSEVQVERMSFAERSGRLVVTTSFSEIFDQETAEDLSSGLSTTLVLRIYVYKKGRELPVSFVLGRIRVAYDLWEEVYIVRTEGPLGKKTRRYERRSEALEACTRVEEFPIAPLDRIAVGPHYFLGMVVELNPLSPELLAEVRRWLSKPAGDRALDTSSSFFGSFVSVFRNPKLPKADAALRLQSQPFYRVP